MLGLVGDPNPLCVQLHLDGSGAFRGLAFANFRAAADADAVVVALNGFDVQGRKLRVEYKKVLQAGEKERIEREKALRRMRSMHLEREQQNMIGSQQQYDDYGQPVSQVPPAFTSSRSYSGNPASPWGTPGVSAAYGGGTPGGGGFGGPQMPQMPSMSHLSSYNSLASVNSVGSLQLPMPAGVQASMLPGTPMGGIAPMTPGRAGALANALASATPGSGAATELDLNDSATLEIYSRILLFKDDAMRDELAFSRQLTAKQRRVVHLVAQKLGVYHYSVGEGDDRYAVVTRIPPEVCIILLYRFLTPVTTLSVHYLDPQTSNLKPRSRSETDLDIFRIRSSNKPRPASRVRPRPTTSTNLPRRTRQRNPACARRSRCRTWAPCGPPPRG
jgi:hypothetical protein